MDNKKNIKKIILIVVIICIILLISIVLINKKINSNNCDNTELENKIGSLQLEVSSLNSEKDELNKKIKELNENISSLEETISSNEKTISDLELDKKNLSSESTKVKNENNNLNKQIKENKEQINSLNNQIIDLNLQISELKNQVESLKEELKVEKETYIVFYSVNNEVIYQEKVKKGQDVKNVPSSPIDNTTVVWENDGKNIQNDMVIHGIVYCTLTFDTLTDINEEPYAFLSVSSYQVPYNTVIEFTNCSITVDGEVIVYSTINQESQGVEDNYTGWGVYDEDGVLDVKTSGTYKVTGPKSFFAYYGGCVPKGTKISMANGTIKNVEDLVPGDEILSYDFFVGNMVSKKVIGISKSKSNSSNLISINLSNGSTLKIVDLEYVFDTDEKKYFLINPDTYEELVGKHILVNNNGTREIATVLSTSLSKEATEHYSLYIEGFGNYIAEGVLTRIYSYWMNDYFKYTDDYKIDKNQLEADILNYGLYTYDDVKEYVSYDTFEKMGLKYLKFIEGKGLASNEYVLETLSMLEYELIEANKRFNN